VGPGGDKPTGPHIKPQLALPDPSGAYNKGMDALNGLFQLILGFLQALLNILKAFLDLIVGFFQGLLNLLAGLIS
jgi:hypothetical protein